MHLRSRPHRDTLCNSHLTRLLNRSNFGRVRAACLCICMVPLPPSWLTVLPLGLDVKFMPLAPAVGIPCFQETVVLGALKQHFRRRYPLNNLQRVPVTGFLERLIHWIVIEGPAVSLEGRQPMQQQARCSSNACGRQFVHLQCGNRRPL